MELIVSTASTPHSRHTLDELLPLVYEDLRAVARRQLAIRAGGGTLSTTGLVHEAYLKLASQSELNWKDRGHFFALSSRVMRQVLVDRAKARFAHKRQGAAAHITYEDAVIPGDLQAETLLVINDAIDRLADVEPRLAQVVDCRFFGGFSDEELAAAMGVTVRTVQRDWAKARMILRRALAP